MIGNKSKMRVLGGDEGSASDIIVNVKELKRILEFKLLKSVICEWGKEGVECCREAKGGMKVAGKPRQLMNARCLRLEQKWVLHDWAFAPAVRYEK